jgi:hypothetical protein
MWFKHFSQHQAANSFTGPETLISLYYLHTLGDHRSMLAIYIRLLNNGSISLKLNWRLMKFETSFTRKIFIKDQRTNFINRGSQSPPKYFTEGQRYKYYLRP